METFSALLAFVREIHQSLVTRSFDVFFDLRMNKRLSKQKWGWWFETPHAHYDVTVMEPCDWAAADLLDGQFAEGIKVCFAS